MPPRFPHTEVSEAITFTNYSGTVRERRVALRCTPAGGVGADVLRKHGEAVQAILRHCFAQNPPATLRAIGSTWSFSRVIEPGDVLLDTANFTYIERVPSEFFTQDYRSRAAEGYVPMFVEGGAQVGSINRRLGRDVRLALQTSGGGDGQRIAGCIATGTHGSALGIGAVHDTVLGVYLVVSPERAVFLQSRTSQFVSSEIAPWLEEQTGIPTEHSADDDLFNAARVSLGSLGIVFGIVLEAAPLYRLKFKTVPRAHDDAQIWHALRTLDTSALHPETAERPYHFDVRMHPYPSSGSEPALSAMLMWKVPAGTTPFEGPLPGMVRTSSDLMEIIAEIAKVAGTIPLVGAAALLAVQHLITGQLGLHARQGEEFPGQLFGPTSLPPGTGASTEIVVNHADCERALRIVFRTLEERARHGEFLLGAVGVRFVRGTSAWLGMNVFDMNCYIELPSIRNDAVLSVYRALWDALESAGINFTCHWGQLHGINLTRLTRYFGDRAESWKAARLRLLDPVGRRVFAAPILGEVGLDSAGP